jgi:hypothetical protein
MLVDLNLSDLLIRQQLFNLAFQERWARVATWTSFGYAAGP